MRAVIILLSLCLLVSCKQVVLLKTPKKEPIQLTSALSIKAQQEFWNTLHQGKYDKIAYIDMLLTSAYLENPNDPAIASHLGFLHIWKLTERNRIKKPDPMIVNEIILSKKYFKDSLELNPNDARILGFYGDSQLAEGKIFQDQREEVSGYFTLKKAIHQWPQFNYFTGGYVMSSLPADSKEFKEGLEWQWKTLDLCAHQTIDRNNPDFRPYMHFETQTGLDRACWNSWIAPYNFEGFFLNMGDMLVKAGDWQRAIQIYQNAKLASNYSSWPYKKLLEDRIIHAQSNVDSFREEHFIDAKKAILFNSGYGCVACHQRY